MILDTNRCQSETRRETAVSQVGRELSEVPAREQGLREEKVLLPADPREGMEIEVLGDGRH